MKIARILLPVLAALALAACGSTKTAGPAGAPKSCFNAANVTNYAGVDRETVNLRVGVNDFYQVKMLGVCPNIDWTQKIGLESTSGSTICTGLDLTIHVPGPTGPQECAADSIRKLTPEEVAALPKGQKP